MTADQNIVETSSPLPAGVVRVGIVSYSMPKGDKRSNGIELTDLTYDGQWGEELRNGLGQLVDGQFGGDEIREAAKSAAWVGWRNDSRPTPPVLTFEFDKVREFSAVHLFCNNKFMRDVQVSKLNFGIVSYSMPKGDKRSNGIELTDLTYDGQWGEELRNGLGQLVDGQFGGDEIREAAKSAAWVGWRNDSRPTPPVLTFEFDKVREFSAVHLFCNNKFMRDVQVFSEAIVTFSIGGRHFQDEPIRYTNVRDNIFENSRNVTIKLHHRIGKWVRIQLHFSARWILISEVVFDSDVAQGNYTPEILKPTNGKDKAKIQTSSDLPISTAHQEDPLYMAIVVGVLSALVIMLAVAVFLIIHRHRHRKCFASPLAKTTIAQRSVPDNYNPCGTSMLPDNKMIIDRIDCGLDVKSDEYQEPYQAIKCPPNLSYSTVLLEMKDFAKDSNTALS
ncbi:jg22838, partial [Pararge aegeria aegeria]